MIIFFAMLVPFVTAIVLYKYFHHRTSWWELLIPFVGSLIFALIFHFTTSYFQTSKDEFHTGWATKVTYTEAWNEKVRYTTTTGTGKNRRTVTRTRIDHHPPTWVMSGSNGERINIDQIQYSNFVKRWGNEQFIEMNRRYHTKDGDAYSSTFNNVDADMEVITSMHRYKNKVAASRSVFKLDPPSKEEIQKFQLFEYPDLDGWKVNSVLGHNVPYFAVANKELSIFNAKQGRIKEIRVWLLIFKDQPIEAAYAQQNYWINGNMNEYVICVGVDSKNNLKWSHVFSWCDRSEINVAARNFINQELNKPFNPVDTVNWVKDNVPRMWQRKDFEKDFDYLAVDPPTWAIVTCFLLTILLNIGISWWVIANDL